MRIYNTLRGEGFAGRKFREEKKLQNFRDLLLRMRSLEHFCGDKLSRLDVKAVNFLPF